MAKMTSHPTIIMKPVPYYTYIMHTGLRLQHLYGVRTLSRICHCEIFTEFTEAINAEDTDGLSRLSPYSLLSQITSQVTLYRHNVRNLHFYTCIV